LPSHDTKHRNKKRKKDGNSVNYTVDDLYLESRKDLGEREVR